MKSTLIGCTLALLAFGCGDKSGESSTPAANKSSETKAEKKADKAPEAPAAAPPKAAEPAPLKIEQYGVQIDAPAGAKAESGAGTSLMIMSPEGNCTIMLSKKDDMSFFPSYDSTVGDIEKGLMGKKKDMLINEKTDDDNWVIHYTKESMMDPSKTQHGIDVRKKIGEDVYSCGRVVNDEADATCVLNACKSLKPL